MDVMATTILTIGNKKGCPGGTALVKDRDNRLFDYHFSCAGCSTDIYSKEINPFAE